MSQDAAVWLRGKPGAWLIDLAVQPGARRDEVLGEHGDRLKIRISAPPVDGKANAAVVKAVAGWLSCPASAVSLAVGQTSRQKTVKCTLDAPAAQLIKALMPQA